MLKISKFWNNWDMLAVIAHFLGIATAIGFFIFVCWFACIKVAPLSVKKEMEMRLRHK